MKPYQATVQVRKRKWGKCFAVCMWFLHSEKIWSGFHKQLLLLCFAGWRQTTGAGPEKCDGLWTWWRAEGWRSFTSQNGLVKAQFCFYCHIKLRSLGKVTLGLCYRILEYQSIVLSGWIKTEQKSKNEMLWIHIKVIRKMQLDATERTELFFYCARGELGPGAVLTALPTNILHN